jgi:hypothetical protein
MKKLIFCFLFVLLFYKAESMTVDLHEHYPCVGTNGFECLKSILTYDSNGNLIHTSSQFWDCNGNYYSWETPPP